MRTRILIMIMSLLLYGSLQIDRPNQTGRVRIKSTFWKYVLYPWPHSRTGGRYCDFVTTGVMELLFILTALCFIPAILPYQFFFYAGLMIFWIVGMIISLILEARLLMKRKKEE